MIKILTTSINIVLILAVANNSYSQTPNAIGDGGLATNAILQSPSGVALDESGNLYIAERRGNRIRKVDYRTGIITTFVGTGQKDFGGDNGLATEASIANPEIILVDKENNLIIADRGNHRVRKVDLKTNIINTIAGNGEFGYSGDHGKATQAQISNPFGIMIDDENNLFILDTENHAIRKVDYKSGIITTFAGNGKEGFMDAGNSALSACFNRPHVGVVAQNGNVWVGDSFNHRICIIDPATKEIIKTYGSGQEGFTEDGFSAEDANFAYFGSLIIHEGKLFISGWGNNKIRVISLTTGLLSTLKTDEGKPFVVSGPYGMAISDQNYLYISEVELNRVLKYNLKTGEVTRIAGK